MRPNNSVVTVLQASRLQWFVPDSAQSRTPRFALSEPLATPCTMLGGSSSPGGLGVKNDRRLHRHLNKRCDLDRRQMYEFLSRSFQKPSIAITTSRSRAQQDRSVLNELFYRERHTNNAAQVSSQDIQVPDAANPCLKGQTESKLRATLRR